MKQRVRVKDIMFVIFAALLIVYLLMLVTYSESVKAAAVQAIERCMNTIIPSLFSFMAVSGLIVKSGIYSKLSVPFCLISKHIFNMPVELFSIFLISNVAGYPVGAKTISELCEQGRIDRRFAGYMLCFCYGAGPAFFNSVIGLAIFGSVRAGMIVFLSCLCTNMILAAVICRIKKPQTEEMPGTIKYDSQMLTDSILQAGRSLFEICVMIVFFSTFIACLERTSLTDKIGEFIDPVNGKIFITSVLELTSISGLTRPEFAHIPIVCALCSFGGVCVVMQIKTVIKGRLSMMPFLLTRPIACVLSFVNYIWISRLMLPESISAFSMSQRIFVKVNNFIPSVCLILMIFMLKVKKGVEISK